MENPYCSCKLTRLLDVVEANPDDDWRQAYAMDRLLFREQSAYQLVEVFESGDALSLIFHCLVLDRLVLDRSTALCPRLVLDRSTALF